MSLETVGVIAAVASPVFYAGVFWRKVWQLQRDLNGVAKRQREYERQNEWRIRRVLHVLADVCEGDAHQRIIRILVGE